MHTALKVFERYWKRAHDGWWKLNRVYVLEWHSFRIRTALVHQSDWFNIISSHDLFVYAPLCQHYIKEMNNAFPVSGESDSDQKASRLTPRTLKRNQREWKIFENQIFTRAHLHNMMRRMENGPFSEIFSDSPECRVTQIIAVDTFRCTVPSKSVIW